VPIADVYLSITLQDEVLALVDPKHEGQARHRTLDAKGLATVDFLYTGNPGVDNQPEELDDAWNASGNNNCGIVTELPAENAAIRESACQSANS
jgi:hypothetical protein